MWRNPTCHHQLKLYKMTQLESSFGVISKASDKRRPKQMNIKELIGCYIEHRREVIFRRTQFQLKKAEDRAHILEGYLLHWIIWMRSFASFVLPRAAMMRVADSAEKFPFSSDRQMPSSTYVCISSLASKEKKFRKSTTSCKFVSLASEKSSKMRANS